MDLRFEEVAKAYFDCRKNKRTTIYQLQFEFDLEKNLFDLYCDLVDESYQIGRSIAFVVEQPRIREVWAATFRDRVVHHIIYNRLAPRFYPCFIQNSFACIPGRGTLTASDSLWSGLRSITRNWHREAYYLGADVRNFFVSIDKVILFKILCRKINEPWLFRLTKQVLFHDPRSNCFMKSRLEAFARVPRHKSLWRQSAIKGLPIGNLTSQFFANVYLNELDQFMKHRMHAKYYYRYVDDFIVLDQSVAYLNSCYCEMGQFLKQELELELHPFKKRLGLVCQGVDFVGYFHKPYRRFPRKRTTRRAKSTVIQWRRSSNRYSPAALSRLQCVLSSYMGLMRNTQSFRLRRHLGEEVRSLFIWPDKNYQKLILPKPTFKHVVRR